MELDSYFKLNNSPEDPRTIDYRKKGAFPVQKTYYKGELQQAEYSNDVAYYDPQTDRTTFIEEVAVRETYKWTRKTTGIMYSGFQSQIEYIKYDGEGEPLISVLNAQFDSEEEFEQVVKRLLRNLYHLGGYIDDSLQTNVFFSMFAMAIEPKTAYEHAVSLPLITYVNTAGDSEAPDSEINNLMATILPNGKSVRQYSLEQLFVNQTIDYLQAIAYIQDNAHSGINVNDIINS